MKDTVKSFMVSIVILFLFVGYQSQQTAISSESDEHVCTACEKGQSGKTVWCESCNAGYVNSEKITCKGCFDSKTKGTICETCMVIK